MTACPTCHRPMPEPCSRCGAIVDERHTMRHKTGGGVAYWCDSCYQAWVTAKEFREFEVSVKFGEYPRGDDLQEENDG